MINMREVRAWEVYIIKKFGPMESETLEYPGKNNYWRFS